MKQSYLFALWGGLFILCAVLGFIPAPSAALQVLMTLLSIAFFAPAAMLLYRAGKTGDRATALLIRNLCAVSLALTAALLIATFLAVFAPAWLGDLLHILLLVLSTPMICSGYWVLSLLLWACLLMASLKLLKTKKNP